jgi:hypothetical protein
MRGIILKNRIFVIDQKIGIKSFLVPEGKIWLNLSLIWRGNLKICSSLRNKLIRTNI